MLRSLVGSEMCIRDRSDATLPTIGIETIKSHALRTIGEMPDPSDPITKAAGKGKSESNKSCDRSPVSRPIAHRPDSLSASIARTRFGCCVMERCSTAPADALTTAGVTPAARSLKAYHFSLRPPDREARNVGARISSEDLTGKAHAGHLRSR